MSPPCAATYSIPPLKRSVSSRREPGISSTGLGLDYPEASDEHSCAPATQPNPVAGAYSVLLGCVLGERKAEQPSHIDLARGVSLARFSNTLYLSLFLSNFCKWLLTLSMSPILTKVGVQFTVHRAFCVLSLFGEPTGDEIFSPRLQYKGKQIQIAKMGRPMSIFLSFAKCYSC